MKINRRYLRLLSISSLVFASLILFKTRDFEEAVANPLSATNLHKVIAVVFAIGYFSIHLLMRGIPRRVSQFQAGYLVYIALGITSSLIYSQEKIYSIWKILEVSSVLLLSLYVSSTCLKRPSASNDFYEICLAFLKFLMVVTAIGALIYPSEAFRSPLSEGSLAVYGTPLLPYQLFGTLIQLNPNSLGAISAILLFVYARRFVDGSRRLSVVTWMLLSTAFIILSQSRTAFAGLLAAFAVTVYADRNQRAITKIFLALVGILSIASISGLLVQFLTRGVDLERLATLSGRMVWWEVAIREYLNADALAKLIGMGFVSASRTILSEKLDQGGAATLHSDYIDALVSTGAIGVLTLSLIMFTLLINAYKQVKSSRSVIAIEMLGIVVILFIRSFTGTTVATHNMFLVLIFSIAVYLQVSARQKTRLEGLSNGPAISR